MKKVYVLSNRYMDSVTLMDIALKLAEKEGINGAECGMGTKQNIELLVQEGYNVPNDVTKNDLMLALDVQDEQAMAQAYAFGVQLLTDNRSNGNKRVYHSIDEMEYGEFDVVQISLPGQYAITEAKKAIDKGMDVFIFTADVTLEEERELKEYGRNRERLVMGPDAGVGLLGGVAMAAGSIVRRGPIGVIGASGSGSQEVACLIEAMGSGVTCILGTGGRDLNKKVGGVSMKANMKRLEQDEDTKVICLVSMFADREVMKDVLFEADKLQKPVVAVFLGADEALYEGNKVVGAFNLQQAAKLCVRLAQDGESIIGWTDEEAKQLAKVCATKMQGEKRCYFRGLYTGGTFVEEALITFCAIAPEVKLHTNRDTARYAKRLTTHKHSVGHTLLDMGDLDFTAEAPHTVFDPAQRFARFRQELDDPQVGLIAMDIILGPGVASDPASCYLPLMRQRKDVIYVVAVCGGEGDPQNKAQIQEKMREAGAIVADSNYESARLCALICQEIEG
ncbi:MAG: hypothetical protein ACOX7B_05720 [Christensenellales bacterium]